MSRDIAKQAWLEAYAQALHRSTLSPIQVKTAEYLFEQWWGRQDFGFNYDNEQ